VLLKVGAADPGAADKATSPPANTPVNASAVGAGQVPDPASYLATATQTQLRTAAFT